MVLGLYCCNHKDLFVQIKTSIDQSLYVYVYRTNKKIPKGPPSPPAPVMHSPNRKVTVKEQQEWKIPPCISNWKNAKVCCRYYLSRYF